MISANKSKLADLKVYQRLYIVNFVFTNYFTNIMLSYVLLCFQIFYDALICHVQQLFTGLYVHYVRLKHLHHSYCILP